MKMSSWQVEPRPSCEKEPSEKTDLPESEDGPTRGTGAQDCTSSRRATAEAAAPGSSRWPAALPKTAGRHPREAGQAQLVRHERVEGSRKTDGTDCVMSQTSCLRQTLPGQQRGHGGRGCPRCAERPGLPSGRRRRPRRDAGEAPSGWCVCEGSGRRRCCGAAGHGRGLRGCGSRSRAAGVQVTVAGCTQHAATLTRLGPPWKAQLRCTL